MIATLAHGPESTKKKKKHAVTEGELNKSA